MSDDIYDPIHTLRRMAAGALGEVGTDETAGANGRMKRTTKAQRRWIGSPARCSAKRPGTSPAGEGRWRRSSGARSPPDRSTPARRLTPRSEAGKRHLSAADGP